MQFYLSELSSITIQKLLDKQSQSQNGNTSPLPWGPSSGHGPMYLGSNLVVVISWITQRLSSFYIGEGRKVLWALNGKWPLFIQESHSGKWKPDFAKVLTYRVAGGQSAVFNSSVAAFPTGSLPEGSAVASSTLSLSGHWCFCKTEPPLHRAGPVEQDPSRS